MSVMYNPSLIAEARRAREVEARYARAHVDGFRWARRGVLPDQLDAELTTEIGLSVGPGHRRRSGVLDGVPGGRRDRGTDGQFERAGDPSNRWCMTGHH